MNIAVIPLMSSIISLIFTLTVLDQFFARRFRAGCGYTLVGV